MKKILKFVLIATAVVFMLGANVFALAQTDATANADQQISAGDLGVSEPTLLPDSPFYFLKNWARGIKSAFTFDNVKKAELENKFTNEKLLELKKMSDNGVSSEKIKKAAENYQKAVEKLKNTADKIKDKAENNTEVNKFLEKFTNHQVLQEKILQKLEGQVPANALQKIKDAREAHLEKFQEVMTKLETNKEKIAEKIKNALLDGNEVNSEILDKIKEKMPDNIKQKLEDLKPEIKNKIIEKLMKGGCKTDKDCCFEECGQTNSMPPTTFCAKNCSKKCVNGACANP